MRSRLKRVRAALLVSVGLLATAAGIAAWATDLLRAPELDTVDARFAIRGDRPGPKDVVVVAIDDRSLSDLRTRFPFPRTLHATAIDRLRRAGAKAIAYDVQFTEPTSERADAALYDAIARARNVVLAATEVYGDGDPAVLGGPDIVSGDLPARVGSANFDLDADGVYRRAPYELDGLPGFARAAVERATGKPVTRDGFERRGAWIDYAGEPGTIRTVSFSDLVRGRVDPRSLRGKVVVVGAAAPTLQDVHPTSVADGLMPGPEIQANAIATILDGLPLRDAPGWADVLLLFVVGLATPLSALALSGLRPLLVAAALLAALLVGAQLAFEAGWIVVVSAPLLALALSVVGTLAVYGLTELRARRRLRAQFARFVPVAVVDEVVERAEEEDLRLGGRRLQGTVLFCDLRGFTAWAERREASAVIEALNRYLTEMSDAILDHGGTVVSYMGDGIMAVFGAPLELPDHADRALAAAREMRDPRRERFNAWMQASSLADGDGFRLGIGLNSGPVMSGNVGSTRRLEYTAVGDTTNVAARLEAATKDTTHQLLIADSTRAALTRDASGLLDAGELTLRGRSEPTRVWTLAEDVGS